MKKHPTLQQTRRDRFERLTAEAKELLDSQAGNVPLKFGMQELQTMRSFRTKLAKL